MNVLVTLTLIFFLFAAIFSKGQTIRNSTLVAVNLSLLLILYFLGGIIWNRIRVEAGPGYLGFIYADTTMLDQFQAALGPVILGIGFPYLLTILIAGKSKKRFNSPAHVTLVTDIALNIIILSSFLISILGEGSSIFFREVYLSSNGISVFLRLSGITNIIGIAFLGLVYFVRKNRMQSWEFFLLLSWFFVLVGKGSRSAFLPFGIIVLILIRNWESKLIRIIVLILTFVLVTYISGVIFLSRHNVHGLLKLPENFFIQIDSTLHIGINFRETICLLLAALFTSVVTVPLSIGTLNLEGILANANPLISNISSYSYDTTSNGVERIFPYSWVPASSAGTLFGVLGSFGIFAIFLIMSSSNMYCTLKSSWSISGICFKLAEISFFAQIFFYLQYSTRIWFRVFWAYWISFALGIIILVLERNLTKIDNYSEG